MREESVSSTRLRRIGRALRELREESGSTLKKTGRQVERSGSSLSLIENGLQPLRSRDLKHLLDVYSADPTLRAALMTLVEQEIEHKQHGWWLAFGDLLSAADRDYASLEYDASALDAVETRFVPGLLQTAEYTRAIIRSNPAMPRSEHAEQYVEYRMARQRILRRDDPPRLRVVIDEAALRRARGGPAVMRAQLHRLLEESHRESISLQVLPFSCTTETGVSAAFWTLEIGYPSILTVTLITHVTGRLLLEEERDLDAYREAFRRVREVSLSESESRAVIHRIISEL
ncbi:MAG: DNA-binding protein [Actinomycetia bacterium]|nr:DNA-binding protein [Actinomycetes bacterium]